MGSFYAISNNKNNNNNQTQTQPCATVCLCVCRGHLSSEWPRIACSDHSSPGHPVLPGQVLGGPDGWSGSKLARVSGSDLEANKGQGRCDNGVCVCACVCLCLCVCVGLVDWVFCCCCCCCCCCCHFVLSALKKVTVWLPGRAAAAIKQTPCSRTTHGPRGYR